VTDKEKAAYIEGLRYARTLCDMACAGFSSGGHVERLRGAKLCSEHIGLVIDRESPKGKESKP
jgi:hypothetical protein